MIALAIIAVSLVATATFPLLLLIRPRKKQLSAAKWERWTTFGTESALELYSLQVIR